ncbi:protein phosphatase 2C-like domain-containing protein 1 [Acomys russatus]|uniref:protein phosphatase 2C-like domain-containing protein 1 n=1 Tax=Acomys russatus TaxID=60746 RepID=UPI0021E2EC45|nr:protein phosphatase 2C-like domain-containing protein 1 [Acomys russatus]
MAVFWRSFSSDESVNKVKTKQPPKKRKLKRPRTQNEEEFDEGLTCDEPITFPCSVCHREISAAGMFFHKKHHNALSTLGFHWRGGRKPVSSVIISQRQFVISKFLTTSLFSEKVLQSMNYAFELLRKKQVLSHFKLWDTVGQTSTYSPNAHHLLIKGVAICGNSNSTWEADPNCKFTFTNDFGDKANTCFFALFDGHYGSAAADLASKEFQILLLHQLSKQDPSYQMTDEQQKLIKSFHTVFRQEYKAREEIFSSTPKTLRTDKWEYEKIHKAFAKAFWRMDRLLRLGRNEISRVRWSGCSALTCLLEGGIKYPYLNKDWRENNQQGTNSFSFQKIPQIISGVLHIANAGNVQAVLCRNGKEFCLTKEHTTQNTKERRRVLHKGAVISSNEAHSFLEGHIKTTRGLGFHGNLTLKNFIIPAPQTISVPIDDLCQFLILATNGLWEVLDMKEVTALVITLFHTYKETCASDPRKKSWPSVEHLSPPSDNHIHVLFQYTPESEEVMSTTNLVKTSSNSIDSEASIQLKNAATFPPEVTNYDACSKKETNTSPTIDSKQGSKNEFCAKNFYEDAAEYIGCELISTALAGGSRDSITVMVMLLSGS